MNSTNLLAAAVLACAAAVFGTLVYDKYGNLPAAINVQAREGGEIAGAEGTSRQVATQQAESLPQSKTVDDQPTETAEAGWVISAAEKNPMNDAESLMMTSPAVWNGSANYRANLVCDSSAGVMLQIRTSNRDGIPMPVNGVGDVTTKRFVESATDGDPFKKAMLGVDKPIPDIVQTTLRFGSEPAKRIDGTAQGDYSGVEYSLNSFFPRNIFDSSDKNNSMNAPQQLQALLDTKKLAIKGILSDDDVVLFQFDNSIGSAFMQKCNGILGKRRYPDPLHIRTQ